MGRFYGPIVPGINKLEVLHRTFNDRSGYFLQRMGVGGQIKTDAGKSNQVIFHCGPLTATLQDKSTGQ